MHFLGLDGMPRRIPDYTPAFAHWNYISTVGYMITIASHTLQTDRMLFGVLVLTFMGVILVEILRQVERRFRAWRPRVGAQ